MSLFVLGLLVLIPLTLNFYTRDAEPDFLECLISDISKDIVSISDYCNSDKVLDLLSSKNKESLGLNTSIFMLIKKLKESSLDQKITTLENVDLSDIENKLIRSRFYEFFGDNLKADSRLEDSVENYLKAISLTDNQFYLAILNFKISQALFYQEKFNQAYEYIEKSLKYDFEDQVIVKKIEILKGRLIQAMSKS